MHPRDVTIPVEVVKALDIYLDGCSGPADDNDPLFTDRRGRPLTGTAVHKLFERLKVRTGIRDLQESGLQRREMASARSPSRDSSNSGGDGTSSPDGIRTGDPLLERGADEEEGPDDNPQVNRSVDSPEMRVRKTDNECGGGQQAASVTLPSSRA